jgi:hypothetical protein
MGEVKFCLKIFGKLHKIISQKFADSWDIRPNCTDPIFLNKFHHKKITVCMYMYKINFLWVIIEEVLTYKQKPS